MILISITNSFSLINPKGNKNQSLNFDIDLCRMSNLTISTFTKENHQKDINQ